MAFKKEKKVNKWAVVIMVLAALVILSLLISVIAGLFVDISKAGNVALIKVEGPISASEAGPFAKVATSSEIVGFIEDADENPAIKAIIIDINSPGGSPVATDEIATAIKKANKTTVGLIREIGVSGGYWIASSTDHVIANRMSITGSIGVIGSYLEFAGLLDRYNITYQRLVSGKYKDIGSPLKELSMEERDIIQDILDEIHEEFILEVAENRNLPEDEVREIATGMIFTGKKAKELGLVDELGGIEAAQVYLNRTLNITSALVEYKEEVTLSDILYGAISEQSFSIGQGIGSVLFDYRTGIMV